MRFAFDLWRVLRFATRFPLPETARERADPLVSADGFARAFGVVGATVGLAGGLVALAMNALGAPDLLAASLGVAVLIGLSGALHEDGLADCADGLGGGWTKDDKLRIMRDPHIGTYGVLALVLAVLVRVVALAALLAAAPVLVVAVLIASQGCSRGWSMIVAAHLPLARPDGASAALGQPAMRSSLIGLALATAIGLAALILSATPGIAVALTALILVAGGFAAWVVAWMAQRQIGGQTGDVLGATQQLSDLAAWIALAISTPMLV